MAKISTIVSLFLKKSILKIRSKECWSTAGFLTYLLDKLHEDLNRITKKPYIEMKNKQDFENDDIASLRYWKCYKKMNWIRRSIQVNVKGL